MVWIVAKVNKKGREARIYQQELWNKGVTAEMWEEADG